MLSGGPFLVLAMILALGIFGFCGLAGLRYKSARWDRAEREDWRLAMEFSGAAMLFSLLPFLYHRLFEYESVVWRLASLTLALYLFALIGRIYYKAGLYGARSPLALWTLLVLSAIMLTIEFANMIWEHRMSLYGGGVLWLLFLSGVQFVAFVIYDGNPEPLQTTLHTPGKRGYRYHGVFDERMRREHGADRPDRSTHRHGHIHSDPVDYARRKRYANTLADALARNANRRSVSDAATRRDRDHRR